MCVCLCVCVRGCACVPSVHASDVLSDVPAYKS